MPRGLSMNLSTLVLIALALVATGVAYWKDPGLPMLGAKNGLSMVWFVLPRLIPALILAGMLQVIIPQETVAQYFGQRSGIGAILMASAAGVLTPGGPMVSVPLLVVLANSGMAMGPLVAYMTSWSLFGIQRIIAWEAPLMGWRFVLVRVVPSLAFPLLAGWLVKVFYQEYVSLMVQDVKRIELSSAVKERGTVAEEAGNVISEQSYIFEPSTYAVVAHSERSMMQIAISQLILESKLAQYASRFRAMSAAHDRADESKSDLHLEFNRVKRNIKDERLKEIINGLKKSQAGGLA